VRRANPNQRGPELASDGELLSVTEIFHSIQGEGPDAGVPATFIRLAYCNLACSFCDTDFPMKLRLRVDAAVAIASEPGSHDLVVITGGEPMRQRIDKLVEALLAAGKRVQIETSGTIYQPLPWDRVSVICSPKTPKIDKRLLPYISAYKYIVAHGLIDLKDGLPTVNPQPGDQRKPVARPHSKSVPVFVNPCDEHNEDLNRLNRQAAAYSVTHFGYRLGVQMHKIYGLE